MFAAHIAQAARDHHWLVIATEFISAADGGRKLLECSEVACNRRTAKFIVESGGADGTFQHDVERRCDALRLAVIELPRMKKPRDTQIRHRESGQTGLRF